MNPIWKYINRAKNSHKPQSSKQVIKKQDGTYTHNKQELIERWTEWIEQQFQTTKDNLKPEPMHIAEDQWEKIGHEQQMTQETQIQDELKDIRKEAKLTKLMH